MVLYMTKRVVVVASAAPSGINDVAFDAMMVIIVLVQMHTPKTPLRNAPIRIQYG